MAKGDATGQAYSKAYDSALATVMGLGDRYASLGGQEQSQFLDRVNALEGAGTIEQQNDQNKLDADYEGYLRQQQDAYDRLSALVGSISGTPSGRTTITTKPDNTWAQLLGSLFGGVFGFLK